MKYFGWGTVAGLGMAGLLALAQPAAADDKGTSSPTYGSGSGSSTAGSTDTGTATGSSTTGSSETGTATGSTDTGTTGSMGTGSTASTMGDASSQHLVGTVEKFDQASKELTLANSDKKLKISDDTTVMKDGQQATVSDIQEGDQVRASFSGSGDTLQVSRIEVMSAGSTGTGTMGTTPSDTTSPTPSTPGTTGSGTSGTDTGAAGGSSTGTGTGTDTGTKRY